MASILRFKKISSSKVAQGGDLSRNQKGLTLLECLVSIIIFSIAITGLTSLTVMIIRGNAYSQAMNVATAIAMDKVEGLQNAGYDDIISGGPETIQTIYTRSWNVTANAPVLNTKTIVVTVTWGWLGLTRSITLTTIITR